MILTRKMFQNNSEADHVTCPQEANTQINHVLTFKTDKASKAQPSLLLR